VTCNDENVIAIKSALATAIAAELLVLLEYLEISVEKKGNPA